MNEITLLQQNFIKILISIELLDLSSITLKFIIYLFISSFQYNQFNLTKQ